jgi:ribosomal protein L11 methylase PrmA
MPEFSFRDPAGGCVLANHRVFRFVRTAFLKKFELFLQLPSASRLVAERKLVTTRRVAGEEVESAVSRALRKEDREAAVFEHELIPFVSYAAEWSPAMLQAAAELTLQIAEELLADGYEIKDATPYNVLFRGPEPVFVDLLSFEKRDAGDPLWRANAQFVRTFLLPLLANRFWGIPIADALLTRRDGFEPEEIYALAGPLQRLRPLFLNLVSLPVWLASKGKKEGIYNTQRAMAPEKARFIAQSLLGRLHRTLRHVGPKGSESSTWSGYMETHSYSEEAFAAKEQFVREALATWHCQNVLDVGANTGHFSRIAATNGAAVIAIDGDPQCIDAVWREARVRKLNILPLVVNLARPTPAVGWRNRECAGFLARAVGNFDCVLMLAVLHHLLVTEAIPLEEVIGLAAELSTDKLIIEFVAPEDPMFRTLSRGRDHLYTELTQARFERVATEHFHLIKCLPIPGAKRWLYSFSKRVD